MRPVVFGDGAGLGPYALGADGVALDELTRLGVPVLPGFTLPVGTEVEEEPLRRALAVLEERTGQRLDDEKDPLLLAVRGSAAHPLPGIAPPVLDVGLTARSVRGLARQAEDERYAHESRRQLVHALARSALGVPGDRLEELAYGIEDPAAVVDAFLAAFDFPDEPLRQVLLAIEGLRATWAAPRAPTRASVWRYTCRPWRTGRWCPQEQGAS